MDADAIRCASCKLPLNDGRDRVRFRCPRDGTEFEVRGRVEGALAAFEPAWGAESLECPTCDSAYMIEHVEVLERREGGG